MILCSFRHLNLSFGSKVLFKDAELVIKRGDRIGLLGLNGKGKSSLFKVLEGEIVVDQSTPPFTFDKNESYSYFHVPQDLPSTIPGSTTVTGCFWYFYPEAKTLNDELVEINKELETNLSPTNSLLNKQNTLLEKLDHMAIWSLQQSYLSYCKSLGLSEINKTLDQLSGGQKKKILLSLGLSCDKELILYDEPTNHLDIETIRSFEQELLSQDKTFIMTTHDRYLLGRTTNRIFQIDQCKITSFEGSYTDFLEVQAQKEKDRLLLLNRLKNSFRREDAWMKQGIKARGTRSKKRVENYEDIKKDIRQIKENAKRELSLSIGESKRKTKILIDAKELSFSYPNNESLFEDLSFEIYRGNKIGIIGENGTGKTTLLNILSGALTGYEGSLRRADDLKICHFSQQREELPLEKSPFEILGDGTDQVSLADGSAIHVMSYFKRFLFNGDEIHRPLRTFSGGERNRLQLALNLKQQADIWIFDEPTNDLDLETLIILEKTLSEFEGSVIIISHDRAFLKNTTNTLFVLENKSIEVFEGGYEQAEAYLEARALEKDFLAKEFAEKPIKKEVPKLVTEKPKYVDPKEVQSIEESIQEIEGFIEKLDGVLQNLGALQSTQESIEKLAALSDKKTQKEEELMELYEKLELLQS